MTMKIDLDFTAKLLNENDNIVILTHAHPDADTLGSGYALSKALRSKGKRVHVECSDKITSACAFMTEGEETESFEENFVVAVDVADERLLGEELEKKYSGKINLCIDHHGSNKFYSEYTCLDSGAAATTEIIYALFGKLKAEIDKLSANCLYAGLATDTGCFLYSTTTSNTHRIAAELIDKGADFGSLNRVFFETKSKEYLELEKAAMNSMEFFFGGLCAVTVITLADFERCGASLEDYERIPSLSRQIEGVIAGIAMREQSGGGFKCSLRTYEPIDASSICKRLDGGGHARAAGCTVKASLDEAKKQILESVKLELAQSGINI